MTHLMESLCALYSMAVPTGRLRTLLKVSLILLVTIWSQAVLFQIERMSSWKRERKYHTMIYMFICKLTKLLVHCKKSNGRIVLSTKSSLQ